MCWLNSCTRLTKDKAEWMLSRPGSRYIPTGVIMRDQDTGEMVIVELGRVLAIPRQTADAMLRRTLPAPTGTGSFPAAVTWT
jgi:hypothetical protein